MVTITQLTEVLHSISVPIEATEFKVSGTNYPCYKEKDGQWQAIPPRFIDDAKYIVLGTVIADEIDFDVEPFVESIYLEGGLRPYRNYLTADAFIILEKEMSFRSLLESKGQHFVNPMGEKPKLQIDSSSLTILERNCILSDHNARIEEWQQYENNLVQKLVIIKKV